MKIAVVIPVLNEGPAIAETVARVRATGPACDVVVVDGGSADDSADLARSAGATVVAGERGRARQMNAGARATASELLLFLHADCRLDAGWTEALVRSAARGWVGGCLSQRIDAPGPVYATIGGLAHARARVLRVFYGDQGIWARTDVFDRLGGFCEGMPFLEDVEFSRRLRRAGPVGVAAAVIRSSARDWRLHGWWRVALRNWAIAAAYGAGIPADRLARWYAPLRLRARAGAGRT